MMNSGFADDIGSIFLLVFAAAVPIVNPAGSALIFLDITRHLSHPVRENLARHVALYSFLVLIVSLLIGSYILEFFGISVPVLRVAGGLVVAAAGWKFLQEQGPEDGSDDGAPGTARPSPRNYLHMAFYPLTLPITTGPGTISVMVAVGTSHPSYDHVGHRVEFMAGGLAASAALAILIYLCFAFADRVGHVLGNTGTMVVLRLAAFILFCIGIQIVWTGVAELLSSVKPA
jgi:multiple antibiotic resistance protein